MKNLNITNIQLGMIYIYHIYRQRERELCTKQIATKHSSQTPYNSCNNKPDVRLPKNAFRKSQSRNYTAQALIKGSQNQTVNN